MIKKTVNGLTIEIPSQITFEKKVVTFDQSNLTPVYSGCDGFDGEENQVIGFNLDYVLDNYGSVSQGITLDRYGEVWVSATPLDERNDEEYEHPDDRSYDTAPEPPAELVEKVQMYWE